MHIASHVVVQVYLLCKDLVPQIKYKFPIKMAILSIFGFLVDPTDSYGSPLHRKFSQHFVTFITTAVSLVTPTAFLFLTYFALCTTIWHTFPLSSTILTVVLVLYSLLEVVFFLYCYLLRRRFNQVTSFPYLDQDKRHRYLDLVMQHCANPWVSLSRWFYKHDATTVSTSWMREWIAWAFFSKDGDDLTSTEQGQLDELVDKILDRFPPPGDKREDKEEERDENEELNFMRLHFDEMVVQQKPFIAYLVISIMQFGGSCFLTKAGFTHHALYTPTGSTSTLSYWAYNPSTPTHGPAPTPIFLIPGIGIGVTMYINIVKAMLTTNKPIYILNLPHISLKLVTSVPSMDDTLFAIDQIYSRHKLPACTYLAHSYGSIVTTWVLKNRPPTYISSIVFVDPVCFSLWEPDLIYNFLYRTADSPIRRVAQYFVAQDLLVAYTLFRRFWWLENVLFPEDVNVPMQVYLSSHDFIIDAGSTLEYLRGRGAQGNNNAGGSSGGEINVVEMKGLSHGSFLNSKKYTREILNYL
ncbi:uncharacterized protein LOC110857667 [Folsomia candida]|uniref:uncharacterized protein LOC110857667 n=1 Tax=Folsomia candida TaxID=158441 RepID=UPI000B904075|nr:uncharacterized protein LOC110857667 [Folsomia candida]